MKCLISPPCGFLSSSKSHQLAYMVVIEQHSSFGDPVSRTHEKSVLPHANDQNKFKVYPDTKDQNPDLLYSYKKILISYTAIKNLQPNLMFCCFLKITHENRPQRENFKLPEDKTVPFSFVLCASPVHRIPLGMVCRFSLMLLDGELSALPNWMLFFFLWVSPAFITWAYWLRIMTKIIISNIFIKFYQKLITSPKLRNLLIYFIYPPLLWGRFCHLAFTFEEPRG